MHFTNLTETIVEDLLWADPTEGTGILPSQRGTSVMFGSDITEKFLATNNLSKLVTILIQNASSAHTSIRKKVMQPCIRDVALQYFLLQDICMSNHPIFQS